MVETIVLCQMPFAWVCQQQFENIYHDCSFWCEGWKSNEMHWNLSAATHTIHILHQNHCLFSAGRICQFSNTFYRWSTTMSEHANDYLSFCMERRGKAINLADTHARKKSDPGLEVGRSKATCHQIDPPVGQADDDMPTGLWHQPVTRRDVNRVRVQNYKWKRLKTPCKYKYINI